MKKKLLALMLFAGATMFGGVELGIHIGAPPRPRIVRVRPVSPGVGYSYVDGYWYPESGHYKWHDGYWSRPPYEGSMWIAPHHDGQMYFNGYWQSEGHERVEHDHHSDRQRERDYREDRH
jgi:hypothetical protein